VKRIHLRVSLVVVFAGLAPGAHLAYGEPRCTSCHFSPTGGGLLTDYGRSLSHVELSSSLASDPRTAESPSGEQAFLFGALGDRLGGLRLGLELRPSHLRFTFPGGDASRNLLMAAEGIAAYQVNGWTAYGQVGRHVEGDEVSIGSYEHWVGRQSEGGTGVRVGRFMPAYGVRLADHTAFNRDTLGFDKNDQVYGVEISRTGERSLVQVAVGPGRAESLVDDDGRQAFMTSARVQLDLTPRAVVVASGIVRGESDVEPRSGAAGVAFGFAPGSRVTIWTQVDALATARPSRTAWTVVNETAFEVYKGVWLKASPQLRTDGGSGAGDIGRLVIGAVVLPRTHWNVNVSYFRDRNRDFGISTSTLLTQLHLFL
jgi:hypothetical protein